jgi:hypothetical protein
MLRSISIRATLVRLSLAFLLGLVGLCQTFPCSAQTGDAKAAPKKTITLNTLSMEVNALQALGQFQLDKGQLERIQKFGEESAQKERTRQPAKASKEYRDKMVALRKALQDAKDGDLIEKLNDEVDALHEKEKPTLDDRVDITDAARKRATEAYRLLKPGQIAAYLGRIAESVADPLDRLLDATEDVREMKDDEWKAQGNEIADDISRIAVGLDAVRSKRVSEQVSAFLARARGLSKVEFQKQQGELEKAARKIVGDIPAEVLLRNQVELDLATLISNPRLPQASRAMIKLFSEPNSQTSKK